MHCAAFRRYSAAGAPSGTGGGGARAVEISVDIVIKKARDLRDRIHEIIDALIKWGWAKRKKQATHLVIAEEGGRELEEGEMGTNLLNSDTRKLDIIPKNDKQKRDQVQDGTMKATSLDESVATIALDPADQLVAIITPVDGAISPEAKFEFEADANMSTDPGEVSVVKGSYSCPITDEQASFLEVQEAGDTPKP